MSRTNEARRLTEQEAAALMDLLTIEEKRSFLAFLELLVAKQSAGGAA